MKSILKMSALLALVLLTGCATEEVSPEEKLNDRMSGAWTVYSLRVDGVETIGTDYDFFTLLITKTGGSIGTIKYTWSEVGSSAFETGTDSYLLTDSSTMRIGAEVITVSFIGDELRLTGGGRAYKAR